eukprot:jgi/Hompol1/4693/HPOL_000036-RA
MGNQTSKSNQAITIHTFTPNRLLGKGNFAKVFLVERKKDRKQFALKFSRKDKVRAENKLYHIIEERNILECIVGGHAGITQMCYSFQDDIGLYIVLEYIDSGDLRLHMKHHTWAESGSRVNMQSVAVWQ